MTEKKTQDLQATVADYKRFGFILLSLSAFLTIGLIIPAESGATVLSGSYIIGIFGTLASAVVCHRLAMNAQKKLYENQ
ncbi:YrhC family protein [Bacillus sp. FJAT-45037]|uniref:YrhC family protein n=1 Tax=Bacillus sp. FJAT-45037 TaxID=2011007 RepID=UPI000C23AF46|nr:YrhC family protein [Bacillus sp. FJAT-45037]